MLPPGTQAAVFIASQASNAALLAAHAAAQSTLHTYTFRNACVLELADRLLGELSSELIAWLGLTTTARRVLISAACQRHAIDRRGLATKIDADLVAARLTEALADLRYLLKQRDGRVFPLVGYSSSANRHVVLALKLVAGKDGAPDEWWTQTAYPLGVKTMRRAEMRGTLVPLFRA